MFRFAPKNHLDLSRHYDGFYSFYQAVFHHFTFSYRSIGYIYSF